MFFSVPLVGCIEHVLLCSCNFRVTWMHRTSAECVLGKQLQSSRLQEGEASEARIDTLESVTVS